MGLKLEREQHTLEARVTEKVTSEKELATVMYFGFCWEWEPEESFERRCVILLEF